MSARRITSCKPERSFANFWYASTSKAGHCSNFKCLFYLIFARLNCDRKCIFKEQLTELKMFPYVCVYSWRKCIPVNFFWDILFLRFLSWECWDFWRRHDHFRRFLKKFEVFRNVQSPSPSVRTHINASMLPVLFTSKNQRSRGRYCHLFILHMVFVPYMGLS